MPIYSNTSLRFTDTNLKTTIINDTFISTSSIHTSAINIPSGIGSTGNVLTKTNSLVWDNAPFVSNASTNLNLNNNNITNVNKLTVTNVSVNTITNTTFTNQISFNTSPISILPSSSNQLATKEYVDITSTNSSIFDTTNLFLNFSPSTLFNTISYRPLTTDVLETSSNDITNTGTTGTVGESTLVGNWISNPFNKTQFPSCLFTAVIYGTISETTFIRNYYFELYKYSNGIVTNFQPNNKSCYSEDIDIPPYNLSLLIPSPITILPEDRLIFKLFIYSASSGTPTVVTKTGSNNYSYINIIKPNLLSNFKKISITNDINLNGNNIKSVNNLSISTPSTNTLILGPTASSINIGNALFSSITLGQTGSSIYLGGYVNPTYTINTTFGTSAGKIGYCLNQRATTAQSITLASGVGSKILNYPTIPFGIWMISAFASINCLTAGTLTSASLLIENTTRSTFIARQDINVPQVMTPGVANAVIITCSGILECINPTSSNNITISVNIAASSGTYNLLGTFSSFQYMFTRIA
jgi:hypothetical protein